MRLLSTLHLKPKKGSKHGSKKGSAERTSQSLPTAKIEVVSDTVCPFCYLLYGRLHAAMKEYEGKLNFELHWVPYQLQPLAPPEGVPKHVFMEQKFKDQAHVLMQKKAAFFQAQGLEFSGEGVIGNTFNSHRLVAYAGKQGLKKADEVVALLFKAFHTDGKHINDAQILREIGRAANLEDPDRVADDPECSADEVRQALETKYRYVIGVPHIVINDGQYRLGGAQEVTNLTAVFQELLEDDDKVAQAEP